MMKKSARRALTFLALMLCTVLGTVWAPLSATAASGNTYKSVTSTYTISADGMVDVREVIVVNFVVPSHGVTRGIVVREAWQPDDAKDRVYKISGVQVKANRGASSKYVLEDRFTQKGRHIEKVVKVGDSNTYVPSGLVTYELTYRIEGAMLTEPGVGHNFYWDVIPSTAPPIEKASVTVKLPSGNAKDLKCAVGQGQSAGCTSALATSGTANFEAANVGDGKVMTVALYADEGTISNASPILIDSKEATAKKTSLIGVAGSAVTSVLAFLGFRLWRSKKGRDERFIGLPPGIVPAPGEQATVGTDTNPTIPVAFSPPRGMSPGEAGKIVDGAGDVRDTTATLVDLAVRGAIKIYADDDKNVRVQLIDPNVAQRPHEQALMEEIFSGVRLGAEVDLTHQGSMTQAHEECASALSDMVESYGWYKRMPSIATASANNPKAEAAAKLIIGSVAGLLVLGGGILFVSRATSSPWVMLALPLVPLIVALGARLSVSSRGIRTATGRAYTDQVLGFREYLATAEADQLKFEEGEDIFSKYLPWAISFDLADRWSGICAQLVAMGRLPNTQPDWYYGPWTYGYFPGDVFNDSLQTSSTPEASSGSGSGGFSSGSFSGGGGGGGGSMGTW